jgi:hypothetical protein
MPLVVDTSAEYGFSCNGFFNNREIVHLHFSPGNTGYRKKAHFVGFSPYRPAGPEQKIFSGISENDFTGNFLKFDAAVSDEIMADFAGSPFQIRHRCGRCQAFLLRRIEFGLVFNRYRLIDGSGTLPCVSGSADGTIPDIGP